MSILGLSFSSTVKYLTCGTGTGFSIYKLDPKLEKKTIKNMNGGISKIYLLKESNILGLVGGGDNPFRSKNTLVIYDQLTGGILKELSFFSPIKNILLDYNDRVCIILEKEVTIIQLLNNVQEYSKKITYSNDLGLVSMTNIRKDSEEEAYDTIIATLGEQKGSVLIWKLDNPNFSNTFQVHDSHISALALSKDGTMIATASESATLIRVSDTLTGDLLYEFRRGSTTAYGIHDLAISRDNKTLACCSGSGTVHLFDMYEDNSGSINTQSLLSSIGGYVSPYFNSQWSFRQHRLNTTSKTICEFSDDDKLHIVTYDGAYYTVSTGIDSIKDETGNIYRYNLIKCDSLYVD